MEMGKHWKMICCYYYTMAGLDTQQKKRDGRMQVVCAILKEKMGETAMFDRNNYTHKVLQLREKTVHFREWKGLSYVPRPAAPHLQVLNLYVPEGCGKNAPVFFPSGIGGEEPACQCKRCRRP